MPPLVAAVGLAVLGTNNDGFILTATSERIVHRRRRKHWPGANRKREFTSDAFLILQSRVCVLLCNASVSESCHRAYSTTTSGQGGHPLWRVPQPARCKCAALRGAEIGIGELLGEAPGQGKKNNLGTRA